MEAASNPEAPTHLLRLNGQGVTRPVYRAVRDTLEVLGFALGAIEEADLSKVPPLPGGLIGFSIGSTETVDLVERKETYTNWLLSKAFQDLARAVNEALQAAYFYVEMLALSSEGPTTWGALQQRMREIREAGNKKHFPELLQHVGSRLQTPLNFAAEYASLQKVRNCLEHRAGVVSERDLDADGKLRLVFPTFVIALQRPDGTEAIVNQRSEAYVEGGQLVIFRVGRIEREYSLGERVVLAVSDYQSIAKGCIAFCKDLEAKLPTKVFDAVDDVANTDDGKRAQD